MNELDRQAPARNDGIRNLPLVRYYIGAICRGFVTAESGEGQYSIRIKYDSLAAMQAGHDALIYLPNSLKVERAAAVPEGLTDCQCVIAMDENAREPRLVSWNAFPIGSHRLYLHPASDDAKAAERLKWLHSEASNNVNGYEWGIYRVKWSNGQPVEVQATFSDFSDLDAAIAASTKGGA